MGLHVRCGIEDNLWNQDRKRKMTHRAADRAAGAHLARIRPRHRHRQGSQEILKIGAFYNSVEETLAKNGFAPNRPGLRSFQQAAE